MNKHNTRQYRDPTTQKLELEVDPEKMMMDPMYKAIVVTLRRNGIVGLAVAIHEFMRPSQPPPELRPRIPEPGPRVTKEQVHQALGLPGIPKE